MKIRIEKFEDVVDRPFEDRMVRSEMEVSDVYSSPCTTRHGAPQQTDTAFDERDALLLIDVMKEKCDGVKIEPEVV